MPISMILLAGACGRAGELAACPSAGALAQALRGARLASQQLAADPLLAGASHLIWAWRILGGKDPVPSTAPHEWFDVTDQPGGGEIWRVRPFSLDSNGCVAPYAASAWTEPEAIEISAAFARAARRCGCNLQDLNSYWFVSRSRDWNIFVRPWDAQLGKPIDAASVRGPDDGQWRSLLKDAALTVQSTQAARSLAARGLAVPAGFWIDGGAHPQLLKATKIRAVLSDEPAVRGWGLAAGILRQRTQPLADTWPEAPEGSLLCLDATLRDPASPLEPVLQRCLHLIEDAKSHRATGVTLAVSGPLGTRSLILPESLPWSWHKPAAADLAALFAPEAFA